MTGSSIIFETTLSDAGTKFHRLFISYKALIDDFVHCRALLGLDGTHLTSKYGIILLTATDVDTRGQLFPLAFAIISAENDTNWNWFLKNLHSIMNDNLPISIIKLRTSSSFQIAKRAF
jgi:MULE transposase domain